MPRTEGGALKIGRQGQRSSAISASNADTILVRGRDLARELIGTISFTDHFWLLVQSGSVLLVHPSHLPHLKQSYGDI